MDKSLEKRMKEFESKSNHLLAPKEIVMGRVDGKSFSKMTKELKRKCDSPWSKDFAESMIEAAKAGCKEIQGCKMAYVQSDEITFLVTDTDSEKAQSYFGYKTRKMNSVVASTVALEFYIELTDRDPNSRNMRPRFDSRFWNIPKDEVVNAFIYRQNDAVRNSIQMLGRHNFSHKDLHKKSNGDIMRMLNGRSIFWKKLPLHFQRGVVVFKEKYEIKPKVKYKDQEALVRRSRWAVDAAIPLFKDDRNYIEKFLP